MLEQTADELISLALQETGETKLTLKEMIDVLAREAWLIQGSQRARLMADMIGEPTNEQMQRIANLDQVRKLLERIDQQPNEVIAWLRKRMTAAAQNGQA